MEYNYHFLFEIICSAGAGDTEVEPFRGGFGAFG
tara:strand:+ start:46268 stop:46369 length:102 start_codon:yes stop_codon:yes gene_type:complete